VKLVKPPNQGLTGTNFVVHSLQSCIAGLCVLGICWAILLACWFNLEWI